MNPCSFMQKSIAAVCGYTALIFLMCCGLVFAELPALTDALTTHQQEDEKICYDQGAGQITCTLMDQKEWRSKELVPCVCGR